MKHQCKPRLSLPDLNIDKYNTVLSFERVEKNFVV